MITVVDYGMGNLGSIANMLKRQGIAVEFASRPAELGRASKIILPGVGAFDAGAAALRRLNLEKPLIEKAREERVPVLGICLGMQLMTESSEEGVEPGLGLMAAATVRFDNSGVPGMKVPHMGWNTLRIGRDNAILPLDEPDQRFYFVHSYHVVCSDAADVIATAHHGAPFVAAFHRGNLFGVQFHPEKSHRFGMRLLQRFSEL